MNSESKGKSCSKWAGQIAKDAPDEGAKNLSGGVDERYLTHIDGGKILCFSYYDDAEYGYITEKTESKGKRGNEGKKVTPSFVSGFL